MENLSKVFAENKQVLIDFYADWCGPCRMVAPIVKEISDEDNGITVVKIDVDKHPEIAAQYGVRSIPTLVAIRDGKAIKQVVGFRAKSDILRMFS